MDCKKWFDTLVQNDNESKKIIGFILLWMAVDDKVSEWVEKQNSIIKGFDKLRQIQSFFSNNLKNHYNDRKNEFIELFSKIPGGERDNSKRIGLHSEIEIINYCSNKQSSNCDAYVKILYKLRNNFFHGSKENDENNKRLICWAFDTLSILLHIK